MTPSSLAAHLDFGRLVAEEPFSLYGEQLLLGGFSAWPASYRRRFPGLRTWQGVVALKSALRRLLGAPADWPLLLASRSAVLMQLAARAMFRRCRRVLTTDLSWPAYQDIVDEEARSTGSAVLRVHVRATILRHGISTCELSDMMAAAFAAGGCDGLFLPAVDHLGIRVPVAEIVDRTSRGNELRFVAIDAAQAFCHVPLDDIVPKCDIVIAGCHKWLQAYHPLGLACFGREGTRSEIHALLDRDGDRSLVADPLSHFVAQLDRGRLARYSETVPLLPLFTAAAAVTDHNDGPAHLDQSMVCIMTNADRLIRVALHAGWQPLLPANAMRSGVLLLRPQSSDQRRSLPDDLRHRLCRSGLLVTTYHGGLIRISPPRRPIGTRDAALVGHALGATAVSRLRSMHCRKP
jgi:hypothetical protein